MNGPGGYGGIVRIKAGTRGTVKITVRAHWFLDQKINDEYDQIFSCAWDVEADLSGKLKVGQPRSEVTPIGDPEAPFQLAGLNPGQSEDGVQISPQWQSFQSTDVPNVQVGVEVGTGKLGGKEVSAGGNITFGNERTYPAGSLVRTFDLRFTVVDVPKPEPEVTIGPIEMRKHAVHELYFEKPRQHRVSAAQENSLYLWYMSLTPETRSVIRAGQEKVKVDGFASTTDRAPNNRELARMRVTSVINILRDFGAKEFDDAAFGEYQEGIGEPEGEVESQNERKVVIEILEAPVTIYEGDAQSALPP